MWKAIKWGFGLLIGAALAYALFWIVLLGGMAALLASQLP